MVALPGGGTSGSSIAHQGRSVSLAPTNRVLVLVPTRGKHLGAVVTPVASSRSTPESNAKTAPYAKLLVLATSILRLPISRPLYRQTNMSGKKGLVLKIMFLLQNLQRRTLHDLGREGRNSNLVE